MLLFSGSTNPHFAIQIAKFLKMTLVEAKISRFPSGEAFIEILEPVENQHVFLVQSPAGRTTDQDWMEIFLLSNALREAGARKITAISPYFGYARQDKKGQQKLTTCGVKLLSELLAAAGVNDIITIDIHSIESLENSSIPITNLNTTNLFVDDFKKNYFFDPLIISPDLGGSRRAKRFAEKLDINSIIVFDKSTNSSVTKSIDDYDNHSEVMARDCVIIDDIIDSGTTLFDAVQKLKDYGARTIIAYITHPVFSGSAIEKVMNSALNELIITDTIPFNVENELRKKIRILNAW